MDLIDRLRCCKCLTDIRGFVFVSCLFVVFHQAVTSGLVSAVLSTLELRYGLTSVQSGTVLSVYNIGKLLVSIPMSYLLGKGSIPVNMGICAFLVGLGCILFSSAEAFGGKYIPIGNGGSQDVCTLAPSPSVACVSSGTSSLYYLLLVGQGLIALGASAPYCIAPAYITNNVTQKRSLPLLGFFFAANALGPAIGFLGGGVLLGYWVDPSGPPPGFENLTSSDAQWVGNWWLGILFCGVCELALVPFLIAFPKHLPDAPPLLEADKEDKISLRDIWRLLFDILTNPCWWLVTLAIAVEAFAVSGYIGFGPKYIQTQFALEAGTASILAGGGVVPAAVIGSLVGGWWDGKKHENLTQTAKFNTKMAAISTVFVIICVFIGCDNQPIYGFGNSASSPLTIAQNCNSNCHCDQTYDPVCGADGVGYFNPCWAGCQNVTQGDATTYSNCQCIFSDYVNTTSPSRMSAATAIKGGCKSCSVMLGIFFFFFFLFLLFTFMNHTPSTAILMRVVPTAKHKSLSLGLNDVMYKLLGSIPGPLIFGSVFDSNCILLTPTCDGADGSCAVYDNYTLRIILILVLGGIFKLFSTIFNFSSVFAIRKHEALHLTAQRTSLVPPSLQPDSASEGGEGGVLEDGAIPLDGGFLAEMVGKEARKMSSAPRLSLNLIGKDNNSNNEMLTTPLTPTVPIADPARRTSGIARGLSLSERTSPITDRPLGSVSRNGSVSVANRPSEGGSGHNTAKVSPSDANEGKYDDDENDA